MCPLLMSGVQKLCNSFLSTRFERKSVHIYDKKMLKKCIFAFFLHFFCEIFGGIKKKQYLCTRFRKRSMTYGHGAIV